MKSLIALAAAVSALLLSVPSASAQSPQTYVVLENVAATPGQAQIGGNAAIPIDSALRAEIDPVGNIVVNCKKGTHGASTTCSNIGTGSGTAPSAPALTLTAPTGVVSASGSKITWSSNSAALCYGVSASPVTPPSAGPAVAGWVKEWPTASSGGGFSLDPILAGMAASTTAKYDFTFRCYSSATGAVGATPVVAYTEQTKTVELSKPAATAGDWCDDYKASLDPAELVHFDQYNADNRGFTAIQHNFATYTGKTPGISPTGPVSVGSIRAPYLPGKQKPSEYYAFNLSLPEQSAGQYLKFILKFNYKNGFVGGLNHDIVATLSPCRGDFRPRQNGAETYLSSFCRVAYGQDGAMIQSSSDPASPLCPVPAGARMYLNVSVRDLYDLANEGSDTSYGPFSNCTPALFCGKGTDVMPQ